MEAGGRNLPKHARYASAYRRFGFFWGLGVEHETYVATSQMRTLRELTAAAMKPERYSVNYFRNYASQEALLGALQGLLDACGGSLTVPVLMNSHSFTDCDLFGEHRTTYEKVPQKNPRFSGVTLWESAAAASPWLAAEKDRVFMWDGDTVEFMTQRFYRARVADVLAELEEGQRRFVEELGRLPRKGLLAAYAPLRLAAPRNEPFATYLTNPRSFAMFNNGTLHVNVTLPTRLGWNREPWCWSSFVERHRRLARLLQWWEPLWVAVTGAGDPLASPSGGLGAAGSQRVAVSRYIGLGTFDTTTMARGKQLQIPRPSLGVLPWMDGVARRCGYAALPVIGLDLNFNKHGAHGLELRCLDQMPATELRGILLDIVTLMDCVGRKPVPDPRTSAVWAAAAEEAIVVGTGWSVDPAYLNAVTAAMGLCCDDAKEPLGSLAALQWLRTQSMTARGWCWAHIAV